MIIFNRVFILTLNLRVNVFLVFLELNELNVLDIHSQEESIKDVS